MVYYRICTLVFSCIYEMALDESKHVYVIRMDRKIFGAVQAKQNGPKYSISPMLVETWTCTPHL
jgi:hypothetical protein